MATSYTIVWEGLTIDNVISQVRAIDTYPAMIRLYDRTFLLTTSDEGWALVMGLDIGGLLKEELVEKKPNE